MTALEAAASVSLAPTGDDTGSEGPDIGADRPGPEARSREELLVGENLVVRYDGARVLDLGRIELRRGELLAILGPNGAGKSTLMRVLAMLETPSSGRVRFRGREGKRAAAEMRRASAAVFQRPHFWRDSVRYNIGLGLELRGVGVPELRENIARISELLRIRDLLDRDIGTLSGGQLQRVALARALVLKPEILFLDEPTANLDAVARIELRDDLEQIARQRAGSVLLITHDRAEAFYLADRVAVLVDGRLIQVGAPADLYENPADPYIASVTGAEFTLRGVVVESGENVLLVDVEGVPLRTVGAAAVGAAVKVAYRPEDLILAHAADSGKQLSTRNAFFATISELREVGGLVRLRLAGPPDMVAIVTRSAREELRLEVGLRLAVRIKATALHTFPAGDGADTRG